MLIGPRGFRAEHARLIAITFPLRKADGTPHSLGLSWASVRYPEFVLHITDYDELARCIRINYPAAAWFDDPRQMLAEFPPTDLRPFLRTTEGDGAGPAR
jgi:hypothetical protein